MIKKVVIPIAGLGTRFLPVTKSVPKEMLPILDRPLLDYAVCEAKNAGIEDFIFITNKYNNFPKHYLSVDSKLNSALKKKNNINALNKIKNLNIKNKNLHIVHQEIPLGLGHAISLAEKIIKKEDFAIILPDDIVLGKNCIKELIGIHKKKNANVLGVMKVEKKDISKYGIIKPALKKGKAIDIQSIIEKPSFKKAPSNFGVIGRYVLKNSIFKYLKKIKKGVGGEIQLTDAIEMSIENEKNIAYQFSGFRYDCGSKLGFLQAQIASAFMDNDMKKDIMEVFEKIKKQHRKNS